MSSIRFNDNERGVTLILFAMTITLIVGFVALVVDIGKQELALMQLRQTADAAALSGARQLNGEPGGWRAAKLSAATITRVYPIHGVAPAWQSSLVLSDGDRAYWDTAPASGYGVSAPRVHQGIRGNQSGYHVTVERGIYRSMAADPEKTEFVSLEAAPNGESMSGNAYQFANAVRVRVKLDHLPGLFTGIFNSVGFDNLETTSYAVMHSEVSRLVAPIAISAQDMLLDTAPQTFNADHQLATFTPEAEYQRRVEISFVNKTGRMDFMDEDNPISDSERLLIDEGLERYRSFIRPPYTMFVSIKDDPTYPPDVCHGGGFTGENRNCKDIPIEAWFAIPRVENVNAEMVLDAFRSGGVQAQIGDIVAPLKTLGNFSTDEALSHWFAEYLNSSPVSMRDFFTRNGNTLPNYPWLRARQKSFPVAPGNNIDQLLQYPSDTAPKAGEKERMQNFFVGDMGKQGPGSGIWPGTVVSGLGALNFTNPLCHNPEVPINDLSLNKVRVVWAMIVAPGKSRTERGRPINYRDFPAMFAGGPQNAVAAVLGSAPTLSGYYPIGVYDGNTLNLDVKFPAQPSSHPDAHVTRSTPMYGSYATNNFVFANEPAALDLSDSSYAKDMESYAGKVDSSYECLDKEDPKDRDKCERPGPPPSLDSLANLFGCFDIRGAMGTGLPWMLALIGNAAKIEICTGYDYEEDCGLKKQSQCPGSSKGGGCCDRYCYGNGRSKVSDLAMEILKSLRKEPIAAIPNTHCLYVLRQDSDDRNDLRSYRPLAPTHAWKGCAGWEAMGAVVSHRIDPTYQDNDPVNLISGMPWSRQSPALVNVTQ